MREATTFALAATTETLRVSILICLQGVGWPTASLVLHLCHRERYPMLDFRALWSLSASQPANYTLPFWCAYVAACRQLATDAKVDMRTLDRALWQFSKEEQRSSPCSAPDLPKEIHP